MNKKFVASLSAMVIASSFFTVAAAPKAVANKASIVKIAQSKIKAQTQISAEMKALRDQLTANSQAAQDLINKVLQSDEYKQFQIKNFEIQKSIVDQQLKEGNISANAATTKKAQLDAEIKMVQDAALKTLKSDVLSLRKQIKTLQTKYPKLTDLIAAQEFKDLKTKLISDQKAIIDRYVADGAMTSEEATSAKSKIDSVSASVDAGKSNINALFKIYTGSGKIKGQKSNKNIPANNNAKTTTKSTTSGSSI